MADYRMSNQLEQHQGDLQRRQVIERVTGQVMVTIITEWAGPHSD